MDTKTIIDIDYDFRTDANGKDPDQYSPTLRKYHKLLWSKPLPNGRMFNLQDFGTCLKHSSNIGEFVLSSDSFIPTFSRWKRLAHIINELPEEEIEYFMHMSYTIGGMIVFPCNKIDGKATINGERGFNKHIADRFDLTLECIRRLYLKQKSPMTDTLDRYESFFDLFDDFRGYVEFFLLDDLVIKDYSIKFFTDFNDFQSKPYPKDINEYITYRKNTIEFIEGRNRRIMDFARTI